MTEEYPMSASQIKTHSSCPKWYEYRYISDEEGTKESLGYAELGSRVHEAIELVLESEKSPPMAEEEMLAASIQNTFRELDQWEVPDNLFETGLQCCRSAASVLSAKEPDILDIEVSLEYDIDRDDLVTGVTGKIDLTTESGLWDWKTGRVRDETKHEERIQGATYMAGYLNKYGEPPEKIYFVYLKEGDEDTAKVRSLEPGDDIWKYMVQHAKKLRNSKDSENFRAKPGGQCFLCEYEFICPASKVTMDGVPYDQY